MYFFYGLTLLLFMKFIFLFSSFTVLNIFLFSMTEVTIIFDWLTLLFSLGVLMISFSVIIFSKDYMDEFLSLRYMFLLLIFVLSMLLLIFSPNLVSILLGWDGLGFSSFCLVMFYQNVSSLNSSMLTVMSNRFGDGFFLLILMFLMMDMNLYMTLSKNLDMILFLLITVGSFTKSAQFPFFVWLPMAMAAPTPISSLVHSSTLVTAGIYLLIRFHHLLVIFNFLVMLMMGIIGFQSGFYAMVEMDSKKIIALSTLSQLSIMSMGLFMNLWKQAFFHLMTHALFKSMLFMSMGMFMLSKFGNQMSNMYGINNSFTIFMMFILSNINLMGFPLSSGFLSKDSMLEMFSSSKLIYSLLMILISCVMTLMYSMRLIFLLSMKMSKMFLLKMKFTFLKSMIPSLMMIISSFLVGTNLMFLFSVTSESFYIFDKFLGIIIFVSLLIFIIFIYSSLFSNFMYWMSTSKLIMLVSSYKILEDSNWLEEMGPQSIFFMTHLKSSYFFVHEKKFMSSFPNLWILSLTFMVLKMLVIKFIKKKSSLNSLR